MTPETTEKEHSVELGISIPESEWERVRDAITANIDKKDEYPVYLDVKCNVFAIGVEGFISRKLDEELS